MMGDPSSLVLIPRPVDSPADPKDSRSGAINVSLLGLNFLKFSTPKSDYNSYTMMEILEHADQFTVNPIIDS